MSIPRLKPGPDGIFYVHWSEGRRSKRVSTRTRSLAEAKAFLAEWLVMERDGPVAAVTVADLWKRYDAEHVDTTAAPAALRHVWKPLAPFFGPLLVTEITAETVRAYGVQRRLRTGKSAKPGTIRRELVHLQAILRWSAKKGLIPAAAVPMIALPPPPAPKDVWLTVEQKRQLFAAAESLRVGPRLSRLERFLWLAYETGSRKQALYDLRWNQVDFETGMIHLNPPGRRQTNKRRPDVPISRALRPILERAYEERINDRVLDDGRSLLSPLVTACKRAGVPVISPHVLRHTLATHLARAGVPIFDVAGVLGDTVVTTARTYAKHTADASRAALDRLSSS